jgi:hypothetical protein
VNPNGLDLRRLFEFLVRCLDHYGPPGSVLFSSISVNLLTPGEIATLQSHPNFRWCFLDGSVGTAIIDLIAENWRRSSINESHRKRNSELGDRIDELSAKFDRLSAEVRDRGAAPERRFESALGEAIRNLTETVEAEIEWMMQLFESLPVARTHGNYR